MNDLLKELEAVVEVAKKATQGEWAFFPGGKRATVYSPGGHIAFCTQRGFGARGERPVTTDEMVSNVQLIASLINLFRTHHAEIAEAVRDAARYRWLRDRCGIVEYKAIAGSVGPGMLPSGDKLDAAIDAMHNIAREG